MKSTRENYRNELDGLIEDDDGGKFNEDSITS